MNKPIKRNIQKDYHLKNKAHTYGSTIMLCLAFCVFLLSGVKASTQGVSLKFHVRGVYESKITLLPLTGTNALKPITVISDIKNGISDSIIFPNAYLPGEFVLRFDYKEIESSAPYPCEKHIVVGTQNLELWANPMYCGNSDSTYFQKDEKENTAFAQFANENAQQKEKLALLQTFLLNYDDTHSKVYRQGIKEYKKRRNNYMLWLEEQTALHKALFVSHTFQFQYVPQIDFKCSESGRVQNVLAHYFDGIDFKDTLLLHTQALKE